MKPGETYRLTIYAKVGNISETAFFGLNFTDVSGRQLLSKQVDIKSSQYQAYTVDFVVPAGTWDAELFFYKYQGTSSIYADDLELVQITNPMGLKSVVPSAAPAGGIGYPFGSRKTPYVAGLRLSSSLASQDAAIKKIYDSWKALLSTRCGHYMVPFSNEKSASVSEGIGYGMLITASMAGYDPKAREYFDGLFRFGRKYPATAFSPYLMDWKVNPDCTGGGGGYNAVDGDLDIAMGLLQADKQWGSNGAINYMAEALNTINAMKLANFRHDGLSFAKGHRLSDNMIAHFKTFKKVTGDVFWDKAVAKAFEQLTLAQSMSPKNLIPGWLFGYKEGHIRPSVGWEVPESDIEGEYDWNSNRIPWRLATDYVLFGDVRSKTIGLKIMDFYRQASGGDPAKIAPGYKLDGTPLGNYVALSFIGPATAGAMVDSNNQAYFDAAWNFTSNRPLNGYYENELQLLGLLVASGNWWQP